MVRGGFTLVIDENFDPIEKLIGWKGKVLASRGENDGSEILKRTIDFTKIWRPPKKQLKILSHSVFL